jgi:hypothetical protein
LHTHGSAVAEVTLDERELLLEKVLVPLELLHLASGQPLLLLALMLMLLLLVRR